MLDVANVMDLGSPDWERYLAAYEAAYCLDWDPRQTTLLSLGTGRGPSGFLPHEVRRFHLWDWITPALDTFMTDSSDQQVRLVQQFFPDLDFRRFQVDLDPPGPPRQGEGDPPLDRAARGRHDAPFRPDHGNRHAVGRFRQAIVVNDHRCRGRPGVQEQVAGRH